MSISDPRLISRNSATESYYHYDPASGGFTVEETQDAEPIIEENKIHQGDHLSGWKGDWHRVASIPLVVFHELYKQGITKDKKKMKAWLNDASNRFFRTRLGRV